MEEHYHELAKRIGLAESKRIPQVFKMMVDDSEAALLLALPGSAPELAEKMGRSIEDVRNSLQSFYLKGLVFPSRKTDPPTYRLCRDIIQFHDATILWPEAPQKFHDLWQEWTEVEWPDLAKIMEQILPRPGMRVIPVGLTLKAQGQVLAFEDVRSIVDQAQKLAVTKCTCRLVAKKCERTLEACVQVDNAAAYAIDRGTGREISKEEALDLFRRCEEEGLIHTTFNQKSVHHVICNCCGDCCQFMPVLIQYGTAVVGASRFEARVDPDLCTGCETCIDRCYVHAVTMEEDIARVNPEQCLGCGLCAVTCPSGAMSLVEVRPAEHVPDKLYG
jgi:Na+-translocating ferredoxin:NAD+ oxidoreductase RNF subunit RnfB